MPSRFTDDGFCDLVNYSVNHGNVGGLIVPPEGKSVKFISDITSKDLQIKSLKYYVIGNNVEFTLNYKSDKIRNFSFFDPPNGNQYMLLVDKEINPHNYTTNFSVPINKIESLNEITMKFFLPNADERNFIFFNRNQLEISSTWKNKAKAPRL